MAALLTSPLQCPRSTFTWPFTVALPGWCNPHKKNSNRPGTAISIPSVWYCFLSISPACLQGYERADSHSKAPRTSEWQVVIKDKWLQPPNITMLNPHGLTQDTRANRANENAGKNDHEKWNTRRTNRELQSCPLYNTGRPPKSRGQRMGSVLTQEPSHQLVKLWGTRGRKVEKADL